MAPPLAWLLPSPCDQFFGGGGGGVPRQEGQQDLARVAEQC